MVVLLARGVLGDTKVCQSTYPPCAKKRMAKKCRARMPRTSRKGNVWCRRPTPVGRSTKPVHAEAMKPNWRVASCMTRRFTYQHIRHAQRNTWRKSAGQGCPAPVERSTKPVHAEAIKPNWRVASCMTRTFTNQHIRHVRKSAGRRHPAPVGKEMSVTSAQQQ